MHIHLTLNDNGEHLFTHFSTNTQGVKAMSLTGARYTVSETHSVVTHIRLENGSMQYTEIKNMHISRQGENFALPDDFRFKLRIHMTTNAAGVPTSSVSWDDARCS